MAGPQAGYLLIADITGYTMYLTHSELEHAQEVLQTLLELVVEHTPPPLVIAGLQGDAVLSYAWKDAIKGHTFVEMIERGYAAFRRAIELMVLNNSCQCNACANISGLDLKFFVHHGTFGVQQLHGREELVGSDVILIHRLLKNHVSEETAIRAYTLYTDAALEALSLEGFREKLVAHREAYEHLGEINTWIQDMHPVWLEKKETTHITIPAEEVNAQSSVEIPLPAPVIWDFLTQLEYRAVLMGADYFRVIGQVDGRVVPGSVYHCYHGKRVTVQTILQWRTFEQITTEDKMPFPNTYILCDIQLEELDSGSTRLTGTLSKAHGPLWARLLTDKMVRRMGAHLHQGQEAFAARVLADHTAHRMLHSN